MPTRSCSARLTIMRAADSRRYERELIEARKESDERKRAMEERLRQERENAELREQFIAVLGHDLRNPLASIAAGARLMLKARTADDALRLEAMMQSSVGRMAKMIESVMDLARSRLGGGILLSKAITATEPVLDQVVAELAAAHPDRGIETHFELEIPSSAIPPGSRSCFQTCSGMRSAIARPIALCASRRAPKQRSLNFR
jgi:sigma-B regulation protein RsbU (phosphoserine phosphatase)